MSITLPGNHHHRSRPATEWLESLATTLTGAAASARGAVCSERRLPRGMRAVTPARKALGREQDRLHELRSTAAGLAISYQLIRDRSLPDTERSRLEGLHGVELARLQRLLSDRSDPSPTRVDLADAIGPLVESLRMRGHAVRWCGVDQGVLGRRDEVVEILHVLLENAACHGDGGEIEVVVVSRDPYAEVWVRDHGPGVPADLLPHLFRRGARGRRSSGSGLGLNIARRRAEQLGGSLRLARTRPLTQGADFVLTLPVAHEPVPCPAATA